MSVSTHVLDAVHGRPAAGVTVVLEGPLGTAEAVTRTSGVTDADGRIQRFAPQAPAPEHLVAGTYRLIFRTGAWFEDQGQETFHPEVVVTFRYAGTGHVHVPLLLSPFAYTTYRGS